MSILRLSDLYMADPPEFPEVVSNSVVVGVGLGVLGE